jgi:hypothetical protein
MPTAKYLPFFSPSIFLKLMILKQQRYIDIVQNMKTILPLFFSLLLILAAHAQKTDVVILKNGDYITGEVKQLDFGLLDFKTDHMSTLSIEWDEIASLKALNQYFRLEREDGRLMYGSIDSDTLTNKLLVLLDTVRIPLNFSEIVRITPIKESVWDRFDVNVDLGYSYTKASTVSQLSFGGKASYRAYRNSVQLNWTSITTDQKDKQQSKNRDVALQGKHIFKSKWFLNSGVGAQQNTELGLDLRLSWTSGVGRNLVQTNHSLFLSSSGISVNREWAQSTENAYNLEAIFTMEFYRFIYQTPQMSLDSYLNVYPNLTDWGRIRTELEIKLKWEIISDLFWNLTFKTSSDNRPPSGEKANIDYNIIVSLGWKL